MIKKQNFDGSSNPSRRDMIKTIGLGMGFGVFTSPFSLCKKIDKGEVTTSQLSDPIYYSSATAIAQAIKTKTISSKEITQIFLNRISEVNQKINAVVQLKGKQALALARKADKALARGESFGPLHGVPFTIKDSLDTTDFISTAGTLGRSSYVPKKDATVVTRLKNAGAILMGKTNTPELTLYGHTDNLVYGRTNNPYNLEHIPGGSSGGPAAIVSAGGTAFDIGSDTGGSIRGPSHDCGVCGIKPTYGRVPRTGHIISFKGYYQSLTTLGPIARCVDDLIQLLPILSGSDGIDPYVYDIPFGKPDKTALSDLKFAFYTDNGIATPLLDVIQAVKHVVDKVANTGARIEEVRPDGIENTVELFFEIVQADDGYTVKKLLDEAGTTKVAPYLNWAIGTQEKYTEASISAQQFVKLFEKWDLFRSHMTTFFTDYDVILCPTAATPAMSHNFEEGALIEKITSYTAIYNLTGWPVAVVRVGTSSEGLPIGIQIVGKPWQEDKVLAVAKFLEHSLEGFQPPTI